MEVDNANCKMRVSQCTDMEVLPIERPLKVTKEIASLEQLVVELHQLFASEQVAVQHVQQVLAAYTSQPKDWRKYAKFDRFRYTRNLVDAGNGAFNLMILCWGPGHASAIHDHADSHCFMKMLSGNLEEVRYDWPSSEEPEVYRVLNKNKSRSRCCSNTEETPDRSTDVNANCQNDDRCQSDSAKNGGEENGNGCEEDSYDSEQMHEIGRTRLELNDVCYINDLLGLHRVENPSHAGGAVSLHVYSPPFNACRAFDARSGRATRVPVTFWSQYGKKVQRVYKNSIADGQQ